MGLCYNYESAEKSIVTLRVYVKHPIGWCSHKTCISSLPVGAVKVFPRSLGVHSLGMGTVLPEDAEWSNFLS